VALPTGEKPSACASEGNRVRPRTDAPDENDIDVHFQNGYPEGMTTLARVPFHESFVIVGIAPAGLRQSVHDGVQANAQSAALSGPAAGLTGPQSGIDRGYRRRLLELGFLEGAVVRVIGAAPLGDPLDVELRGCRFSLRRAEAEAIRVRPAAGGQARQGGAGSAEESDSDAPSVGLAAK
jgi:ferrous iron transport protein A